MSKSDNAWYVDILLSVEVKCPECNWHTSTLYVKVANYADAKSAFTSGEGVCVGCFNKVDESYIPSPEEVTQWKSKHE